MVLWKRIQKNDLFLSSYNKKSKFRIVKFLYYQSFKCVYFACFLMLYGSMIKAMLVRINTTAILGKKIWRFFHVLAQFFFTTSETELDHYHQKANIRVASQVSERLKLGS